MALFTNSPEDWDRLDFQILRDGGISLYWREEYLAADLQALAAEGYDTYQFNCAGWSFGG
jgi:hypothetical protein